jgi:2-phospho-L-lactate/phosphoenolpyruvate guanylyltransferase
MTSIGVVIPIRAFALGKARLADTLDAAARAALGQRWAARVVQAAAPLTTLVVSSDAEVREWAAGLDVPGLDVPGLDVGVLDDPGTLDAAATAGRDRLLELGCARVIVAHADLPYARALERLGRDGSRPVVALVPCHRDDGTPVLSVPTAVDFRFAYGPGSFRRHAAEARRLGLGLRVVRDRDLAFDVDVPDDLVGLATDLQVSPAP